MGNVCFQSVLASFLTKMVMCAVVNCNDNNNLKVKTKCSYFSFPKNTTLCGIWVQRCGQRFKFNVTNARICSEHFLKEDYSLKHRLMDFSARRPKLKSDAVPSVNLPKTPSSSSSSSSGKHRSDRVKKRILVQNIVEFDKERTKEEIDKRNLRNVESMEIMGIDENQVKSSVSKEELGERNAMEIMEVDENQGKSSVSTQTERFRDDDMVLKLQLLEAENFKLKEKNEKLEAINHKQYESMRTVFTAGQIRKLQSTKKGFLRWSADDIASAISLHAAGPRAYRLLRKRKYPLPGVSTLRRWAGKINVQPGILNVVLKMMKKCNMTSMDRACILLFDEIKIQNMYDYDKKTDSTLGPSNYVQVIMARGIFGNWKQPIYYNYDCTLSKDLLYEVIERLEKIGFSVYGINSDLGGGNRGLWSALGISESKTWFMNMVTNKKVYVFADIPHMIKLLRNHYLDSGLLIDGTLVTKEPVIELLNCTGRSDLNIAHKIDSSYLTVQNAKRQKVKLATKLFSHTISKAISRMGSLGLYRNDNNNWSTCSEVFKITNDWFDVFNSKVPQKDSRNRIEAYGLALDEQNEILVKMENMIKSLRTGQALKSRKLKDEHELKSKSKKSLQSKQTKLPFQIGILISIESLKLLFADLQADFNIKYLLTYRLNQDPLEGFFSIIRSIGGLHDHPSPLEFKYRLRNYISGRNDAVISDAANIDQTNVPNLTTTDDLHMEKDETDTNNNDPAEKKDVEIITVQLLNDLSESLSPTLLETSEHSRLADDLSEIEWDGLENLAGYIAFKFRKTENLGYIPDAADPSFTWANHLSEGFLLKPNEDFLLQCKQLDAIFHNINENSLKITDNYIQEHLQSARTVPLSDAVEKLFFTCKMYFRIRLLNQDIKELSTIKKRKMVKIST